jgi:hypothetical protein
MYNMTGNRFPVWRKTSDNIGTAFEERGIAVFGDKASLSDNNLAQTVPEAVCEPIYTKFRCGGPGRLGPYCFRTGDDVSQGDPCNTEGGPFINTERDS